MKILAFAASSSTKSINKKLVTYAAGLLDDVAVEIVDLNDYELPLFSQDREAELGKPALAKAFFEKIGACDALLVSFAEHNGSYAAAYKNLFDWCSRIDQKVFQNKPAVWLSTSPGGRGGATVLAAAVASAPHFGADLKASVSVPRFQTVFDAETGEITDDEVREQVRAAVLTLLAS